MEDRNWKYEIKEEKIGFLFIFVFLAISGAAALWLFKNDNGGFIFPTGMFALALLVSLYKLYRCVFVKLKIAEDGFYHQTFPGNGEFYRYSDLEYVSEDGKCFYYTTPDGRQRKEYFYMSQSEGIEYIIIQVDGEIIEN